MTVLSKLSIFTLFIYELQNMGLHLKTAMTLRDNYFIHYFRIIIIVQLFPLHQQLKRLLMVKTNSF